jgi:hypothetical protein
VRPDGRAITTFDETATEAMLDVPSARSGRTAMCPRCGYRESDPTAMLGFVVLVVANTFVIAALLVAVVWLVV